MFDAIGRDYIDLGFAISQHIDGYVDAYTGPGALREAALDEWPLGVVASLVGVELEQPRAAELLARLRVRARDDLELRCALLRLRETTSTARSRAAR